MAQRDIFTDKSTTLRSRMKRSYEDREVLKSTEMRKTEVTNRFFALQTAVPWESSTGDFLFTLIYLLMDI